MRLFKHKSGLHLPPASLALVCINVVLYGVQVARGVDFLQSNSVDLVRWGANLAAFTLSGEPWRLFTSMFLHTGLMHLVLNMYLLVLCGAFAEKAFGSARFCFVYVICGLLASLTSAWWYGALPSGGDFLSAWFGVGEQMRLVASAGASGALMGIAGCYVVYRWMSRPSGQRGEWGSDYGIMAQVVVVNVVLGVLIPGVDQACHVGGLLAGLGCGFILASTADDGDFGHYGSTLVMSAVAGVVVFLALRMGPSAELEQVHSQITAEIAAIERSGP